MLRVLVAEDSATARLLITSLLASDPDIEIVGQAKNGEEAVALCEQLHPDVVTMDIQMPVMDGLEATRRIVSAWATPVIMVSSLDPADVSKSMLAFNAGALAVLAKPSGPGTPRFEKDCRDLITTVKALAEPKIHEATAGQAGQAAPVAPPPTEPAIARPPPVERTASSPRIEIVGLVASTGGPIALRGFFKALPASCSPPIVIVQHIAAGFSDAFAGWLAVVATRVAKVAVDKEQLRSGVVYVAPDDCHLSIVDGAVSLTNTPAVDGARPSGSVMLASLASGYGARAAGILLSGTGADGIAGLRQLHDAGGAVYVQDEASCTTFETPRGALESGAVSKATPLAEIPRRIANLVAGKAEVHA